MKLTIFALCLTVFACTFVEKVRDGKTAFERKQFAVAIPMLTREVAKTTSKADKSKLAVMLAESYKRTYQAEKAMAWYKIAYDNGASSDALRSYAFLQKNLGLYKEAAETFKQVGIEIGSPYEFKKEIAACKIAQGWVEEAKKRAEYEVKAIEGNSSYSDYSPTLFNDNQLVIASNRSGTTGDAKYNWTGGKFSDLFILQKTNLASATKFPAPINSNGNEGTCTFNGNFTEMIFTRCYGTDKRTDDYCKLQLSRLEEGTWSPPVPLPFLKDKVNYGHPALAKDGNTLYFAANDPEGWGGYDIYVVERKLGEWGEPRILSRAVNTAMNDMFPTLDADTLYFSSEGHAGMGGLDVFKTYKLAGKDNWASVQNLKSPVNSSADDFGYIVDNQGNTDKKLLPKGYFTSSREGSDDIYSFQKKILPPLPAPPKDTIKKPTDVVYKMILDGVVLEKILENPANPNSRVLGRRPLPNSTVIVTDGKASRTFKTDENGAFSFEMADNTNYEFLASQTGFLNNSARFSTRGIGKNAVMPTQTFEVEILLDKIFKNQEITLENIYYDYDKADIRDDAKPTLDKLADVLRKNPSINIQLSSHTDCRGNDQYNANLSQQRAQSAVNYLISKGFSPERLTAKGYGESSPAIGCACQKCTESEHQANRRTTFKVL
jgi:peptidoglycan-associated lipoprotein